MIYVLWLFSHSISYLNQATEKQQAVGVLSDLRMWQQEQQAVFRFIFYNSLHKCIAAVLMKQQEHALQRSKMLFTDKNSPWFN